MGSLTLTKENRLFWLGRYTERVFTEIRFTLNQFDRMIDEIPVEYDTICRNLGIPNVYTGEEDFCRRFTFDAQSPFSIRTSAEYALGNGMVLRDTISSETLAYLQLAIYNLQKAEISEAPAVELQDVLDDITAFRGSFDDFIDSENTRNIIKTGRAVERISLILRLNYQRSNLTKELQKLLNRLYKTDLTPVQSNLEYVSAAAFEEGAVDDKVLMHAVENLFQI